MKSEEWKSYRTRFLVNAKQLSSTLSFVDHLGRQHRGRKGDYLVESSDGVITIAPRHIFEDIYVPMTLHHETAGSETKIDGRNINGKRIGPKIQTKIERPIETKFATKVEPTSATKNAPTIHSDPADRLRFEALEIEAVSSSPAANLRRKLPQPCRDRRASASRLSLM
jgi:hypothetical protein